MKRSADIQEELEQISRSVAGIPTAEVLQIPEDYFSLLAEKTLRNIHPDTAIGQVPAGYFEGLAGSVLQRIAAAEKDSEHLLNGDSILPAPLEVPADYFETFYTRIRSRIGEEKATIHGGRLISLRTPQVFRYAAAAALMLIVSLSVYRFADKRSSNDLPAKDLDQTIKLGRQMDQKQFTEQLETLSDDDILAYLEKHGTAQDVAMLGSDLESGEIPSAEEYITEDNVLDRILESATTQEEQKN